MLMLLLIAAAFTSGSTISPSDLLHESCHNVTIPECTQFNYSTIPGLDNGEISSMFKDTRRLFASGCSNYIQELVCFMLEPTCHYHQYYMNDTDMWVTVSFRAYLCRDFCEAVQRECHDHGAFWIPALNCSSLPPAASNACFIPPDYHENSSTSSETSTNITPTATIPTTNSITPTTTSTTTSTTTTPTSTEPGTVISGNNSTVTPVDLCPGRLVSYQGVSYGGEENCAAPCHYMYEEDRFSSGLVIFLFVMWTVLSFLAIVSFMSFLLTWKHYSHIERPYHFLTLCHSLVFLAFVIRLGSGHDGMVCDTHHNNINDTALVTEDASHAACTAVFIIVYYSILAISVWLVNLSIALCTRMLSKCKHYLLVYYHLSGWGIPLIFVIAACCTQTMVSGESLLGMCQVDNQYLVMLLVPTMLCVAVSLVLLLFAVIQMLCCSQACVEVQHKHPGRFLRSLMFGVFVLIEISIIAILYLIEYVSYEHWEKYYTECVGTSMPEPDCPTRTFTKPSYAFPIIRYSLLSVVGAVSIAWPWTRKVTWTSWKDTASLLYQKIVNSFRFLRRCSQRSRSMGISHQLVS